MSERMTPVKVNELGMLDRRQRLEVDHGVAFEFHQPRLGESVYPVKWTASWHEQVNRPAGGIDAPTPMTELVPQVEVQLGLRKQT
jgi:hypothetical protein